MKNMLLHGGGTYGQARAVNSISTVRWSGSYKGQELYFIPHLTKTSIAIHTHTHIHARAHTHTHIHRMMIGWLTNDDIKIHEMKETWYAPALTWRGWGNSWKFNQIGSCSGQDSNCTSSEYKSETLGMAMSQCFCFKKGEWPEMISSTDQWRGFLSRVTAGGKIGTTYNSPGS